MSEFDPNLNNETEGQEQEPYTPATFEKRTAAWMGIAYMLMLLFLITYALFTGGKNLPGTFPLFLVPVAVAAAVVAIYHQRKGVARGGLGLTILVVLLCAAAVLLGLLLGVPPLVSALQNAYA